MTDLMREGGYPEDSTPQLRADDLSVNYPDLALLYRDGYAVGRANEQGESTEDDVRRAMVDLKAVFQVLLERPSVPTE